MSPLQLDRICINASRVAPTGYQLPNSEVVVVWSGPQHQQNFANISFVRTPYPNFRFYHEIPPAELKKV